MTDPRRRRGLATGFSFDRKEKRLAARSRRASSLVPSQQGIEDLLEVVRQILYRATAKS